MLSMHLFAKYPNRELCIDRMGYVGATPYFRRVEARGEEKGYRLWVMSSNDTTKTRVFLSFP